MLFRSGLAPQDHAIIEFVREFGLILLVFMVGLQVGPGFVYSLRRRGVRLNLMAALIVALGVICTLLAVALFDLPRDVALGLFSGAVTNTPSLAASSQMLAEVLGAEQAVSSVRAASLGYAIAYPFGIIGIIMTMLLVRFFFHINIRQETESFEAQLSSQHVPISSVTVRVANAALDGYTLERLSQALPSDCVISRLEDAGCLQTASPEHCVTQGMLLHIVCREDALSQVYMLVGPRAEMDLRDKQGVVEARKVLVTRQIAVGKNIHRLGLVPQQGITVTRIVRAGTEFSASPQVNLHFGDKLTLVGESAALDKAEAMLGNAPRQLDMPHILPLFAGIVAGVALGSIPVALPHLPAPLKLGLAGGPMLMAIILSRVSTLCGMHWYMPHSANLVLREIGIALFLACVGLSAGDRFFAALADGSGFYWMGVAALITIVPLFTAALIGRLFLQCNYASTCGLLAGSMTDPPALAFAVQNLQSDAPSSVYATVYPLTMVLRILGGQILVLFLFL